jgi:signal transduction histidine kinase
MRGATSEEIDEARSPTTPATGLARIIWWSILAIVAGAFLGVLTVGFIYLLVFGYFVFTPEDAERTGAARELATSWAPALFLALGVCLGAFLLGMRAGSWGVRLGLLTGASAAAAEQAMILLGHPPIMVSELALFAGFGILAGSLGGWFSMLEHAKTEASEKALFDETVSIARARTPDEVARSIANLLGSDRVVNVGLWHKAPWGERAIPEPTGVWGIDDLSARSVARLLGDAGSRASQRDHSMNLMAGTLNAEARRTWADVRVRSAFISPLIRLGGERLGVLFAGFSRATLLTGASRRRVLSAAAAAGLALEKLASLEKQREQDRKLGVLEERERVSREIHDSLIGYLGSIAGELDAAEMAAEAGFEERAPHHISRAHEATRRAIGETRRLMQALRPEILKGSSLPEALAVLMRRGCEPSGTKATLRVSGEVRPLASDMEHDLARIAQEALANARKHSRASRVDVLLAFEPDHITLEVADDGIGLDVDERGGDLGGFGLRSMRERTERIDGRMRVESSEEGGTRVIVEAPTRLERG